MTNLQVAKYLLRLEKNLGAKKFPISFTKERLKKFPKMAGVYAIWKNGKMIYVGETGNIAKRIGRDLRITMNHALRVTIGKRKFHGKKGGSKKKFSPHIERKIDAFLSSCKISYLAVPLGRIELEEMVIDRRKPTFNKKEKRK